MEDLESVLFLVMIEKDSDRPVNALYRGDRFAGYAADAA